MAEQNESLDLGIEQIKIIVDATRLLEDQGKLTDDGAQIIALSLFMGTLLSIAKGARDPISLATAALQVMSDDYVTIADVLSADPTRVGI